MEVKAVYTAVIQKLTDTMNEEPVADKKALTHKLEEVQKSLEKRQRFLEEADESDMSQKTRDHLRDLYEVEDEIDIFAFEVARGRKTLKSYFFNNLISCRYKLKQKMKKIETRICSYEDVAATSSRSISLFQRSRRNQWSENSSLASISVTSSAETTGEEDNNDDDDEFDYEKHALTQKSVSDVWPIAEIPTTPSPRRKKLTFSYSYNEKQTNIRGYKEDNLLYPKQISTTFSYQEEEVGIFGLKDDVKILVKRLTQQHEDFVSRSSNDVRSVVKQQSKQKEMVVQVVGEVGSGKTLLARAVYKNRDIKDHFECHGWISVKEEDTADQILLKLLKTVATNGATSPKDQPLKTRVFNQLKGKRYLIVLDGVRSSSVLEDLIEAFPHEDNGSKILFTSHEEIAINPHKMKTLNEKESWNMFLKKAGKEKEAHQIESRLKGRILNICRGLPLNIVLIAGLLSAKRIGTWPSAIARDQSSNHEVLSLCYEDLSSHSKLCVLYLSLFPKDYDIPVRRLLRLWLAEGFVDGRSKQQCPEDMVQEYFEDLADRSMIEITKSRSDNSPKNCRLVSVLHDYLLPKAHDINLFHIHHNSENFEEATSPFGVRRMVQHMSTTGSLVTRASPSILSNVQQSQHRSSTFDPSFLRSYVSFNFHGKDMPKKEVGILLGRIIYSNFRLLRVLDLEGVYNPSLPAKLGHLCNLRYLGLRRTFLQSLPESVGDLSNLETLDVKHTWVECLPDSIWKLKRLRHLNLNDLRLATPSSSSTLVTLWGLVLDEKISVNESLGELRDLRELGIQFNLSKSQGVLLEWIAKLENLRSLRLTSLDDMGRPSKLLFNPLTKLSKLSHLRLYGNLERLPAPQEFPPTLKVLTLSLSRLNKDPMSTLEQLPSLIVLKLSGDSYIGQRMVFRRGGFKKLEVLKLWLLNKLEEFDVEEEAMESLKELDIRCCHNLNDIPCRLLQKRRCLEELILTDMPDDFVVKIKKRKSKDTSLTINPWKLAPLA